jgi:hypothetical protein
VISLEAARQLKSAGLKWQPALLDFFAIPDRGMDERIFVISDMLATIEVMEGRQVVAFQGASEWALDNLAVAEVVWMPREEQVRELLESTLLESGHSETHLGGSLNGYTCTILQKGEPLSFQARQAGDAYAAALLYLLQNASA